MRAVLIRHALVLCLLIIPSFLATVYFGLILSPRYVAEAQFVVRSAGTPTNQLNQMLASVSGDETHVVHAFIESRDAVAILEEDADLRAILSRREADVFWRFPSLFGRNDWEAMYEHYLSFIDIRYDETTGITTLAVQAFRPEDAVTLARGLLDSSEQLINRLNVQAREDTIKSAREEIALGRQRAEAARAAMTAYRIQFGIFDPTARSATLAKTISELSLERTRLEAELIELLSSSPLNPQIPGLRNRISALEAQIAEERAQISDADDGLADRIAEFERLALEREFADRALASAFNSLETARREAQNARLYIELVAAPREADYAEYPKRLISILFAIACFGAGYYIVRTFVANLFEHHPR